MRPAPRFLFSSAVLSLFMGMSAGSVGTDAHATAPVRLAKATDAEKKQKKVDKATAAYEKKIESLRKKYLDKMENAQLARKTVAQIEKEKASFKSPAKALERAEADASVLAALEEKRDAVIAEILTKHRTASIEAIKIALDKKLDDRTIERVVSGGDRNATRSDEAYEKELAKLKAFDVEDAELETLRQKRRDAIAAAKSAAVTAVRDASRAKIKKDVPAVTPLPGVDRIAPQAPTWCADVLEKLPAKKWKSYSPSAPPDLERRQFELQSLRSFGYFSCYDPEFPLRQKWAANYRQHMSNHTRLSSAHNADVLSIVPSVLLDEDFIRKEKDKICQTHPAKTNGTREENASQHLERIALQCGNRLSRENAYRPWDLDVKGGFKSELAKAAFIMTLLSDLRTNWEEARLGEGALSNATNYVIASALPLDDKTFERELKAMNLSAVGRAIARTHYYQAKGRFDDYTRVLKAEVKKNPPLGKLIFSGPQASLKTFEKEHRAAKDILDTVLAVEDGMGSAGTMNGCAKALFKKFKPYIKKVAKAQKGVQPHNLKLDGMKGFLFAYGLTACGTKDEDAPVLDWTFSSFYYTMSPVKGPLTAAYRGMVDGYNAGVGQQKKGGFSGRRSGGGGAGGELPTPNTLPIEAPEINGSTHGYMGWGSIETLASAVVKRTKTVGGDVKITFATTKWKEQTWSCKDTNKIDRIGSDGKIHYRQNCKKAGKRNVSFTHEPILVPKWAAAGVKKGALLRFNRYPNGVKPNRGWIVEAYASKNQKRRTGLLGAPVK